MTTVATPVEVDSAPFRINLGDEQTEFSGTSRLFADVATGFGVDMDAEERKDWQTLGRASYIVDQYLDVERDHIRPNIALQLFSGESIPDVPTQLTADCLEFLERQTEARQREIWQLLDQVKPLVDRQAAAESPDEVVSVRLEEAELLANLLSLPVEGRRDATARQRFNAWLRIFCRTGYMFDSFLDLKEDYLSGASGVRPNFRARRVIGAAVLKEALDATRTMSPRVIGRCAIVALRYEIRNKKPDFTNPDEVI